MTTVLARLVRGDRPRGRGSLTVRNGTTPFGGRVAHGHDNEKDLSISWPFTFAGLCLTLALSWFCLGFAIADRKLPAPAVAEGPTKLAGHYQVFWLLLAVGAVSTIFGIVWNLSRERHRDR